MLMRKEMIGILKWTELHSRKVTRKFFGLFKMSLRESRRRFVRIWLTAVIIKKIVYSLSLTQQRSAHVVEGMRPQPMKGAYARDCHASAGDLREQ